MLKGGKVASPDDLEALAEDGNFEPLQKVLEARFGDHAGMFTPRLESVATAKRGERLSFATMFVQSNDKFYGSMNGHVALFDKSGKLISGDITESVQPFGAGAEVDQQPGAGADQAPRQKTADQGEAQNSVLAKAKDSFAYPATIDVVRMIVMPAS